MGTATALALKDFKQQAGTATALLGSCQFGLAGLGNVKIERNVFPQLKAIFRCRRRHVFPESIQKL
jgi:hypothetical protein